MRKNSSLISHSSLIFIIAGVGLLLTSFVPLDQGLEEDVLKYTNQFRKSNKLPALVLHKDLNEIASQHSEDMAKGRKGFGHEGFEKRQSKVQKTFKPFNGIAENVAYGVEGGKEVVEIWKNSKGHRKNLLGNYKYMGIGTARDRRGIIYYTQIFVR